MGDKDQPQLSQTDAFHSGAFEVVQPQDGGYRSGMDALLLAAAVSPQAGGNLADLGAGTGVAGLAAINLNSALHVTLIENSVTMIEMARQNMGLSANRHLSSRVTVIKADVTSSAQMKQQAGLRQEGFDHIVMNPPYNPPHLRAPKDPLRATAFTMAEGGIDAWFRTATWLTKPGGTLNLIYRTENIGEVLACCQGRFGALQFMPVHSRADEPAKRILVRGIRGSRAPLSFTPGFIVHEADGSFTQAANGVFKGMNAIRFPRD